MEKVAGYVCNNAKCGYWGSAKYIEYEGEMTSPCPRCGKERTMLPVRENQVSTGEDIKAPAVKLDNGKYYG